VLEVITIKSKAIHKLHGPIMRFITLVIIVVTPIIKTSATLEAQDRGNPFLSLVLGEVTIVSGPTPCDLDECYTIEVNCEQLSHPRQATVKIGAPTGASTSRGTIVFTTGWVGDYWWDAATPSNGTIVNEIRAAGFQTAQIKWQQNWFLADGEPEGFGALACRPATVIRWIYDNLHEAASEQAFCATGHSNGASQLAYSMVRYGISDIFSMVLFESGPNWSRIDHSCILNTEHPELFGDVNEQNTVDWAFGSPNDGTGPCARQDTTQISSFRSASLADTNWSYIFPNTMVVFAFGDSDTTTTASQGKYFHQALLDAGTPLLAMSTVPDAPHFLTEVPAGTELVKTQLLSECRVR
jgi:hypothetical protein